MGGTLPPGVSATDFNAAYGAAPAPAVNAPSTRESKESKSAREAKRRTLQIEYVPPQTSTNRTKVNAAEPASSAASASADNNGGSAPGNAFAAGAGAAAAGSSSAGERTPTQQSQSELQRQTSSADRDTVARSISDLTGAYGTMTPTPTTAAPQPQAQAQPQPAAAAPEKLTLKKPLLTDHMANIVPSALSSTAANASKNSLPFIVDRHHQRSATPTNLRNSTNTPTGGASANSVNRNSWGHPLPPSSRGSYAMPSAPAVSSTNAQAKMAESASGETSRSASLSAATALAPATATAGASSPRDAFPGVQPRPNRSGGGGKNSWRRSTHLDMLSAAAGPSSPGASGAGSAAPAPPAPGSSGGTVRGHKRASTAGSLTEKLLGRSSGTIGRFLSGSQREAAAAAAAAGGREGADGKEKEKDGKERASTKKYPPVSMRDPKSGEDKDSRKSTESSSRRSFYKGSFRARRGSSSHGERERERERERDSRDGSASVSSRGKSRRFSILPNMFTRFSGGSQASSIGRSERDKASVAGARSLQGSPVPQSTAGRQSPVPNLNDGGSGSGAGTGPRMSGLGIDAQMQHLNDFASSGQGVTPTTVTSAGEYRGQHQQPHLDIPLSPSGQGTSLSDQIDQQFAELHRKQEQEYQYKGHTQSTSQSQSQQQQQQSRQSPPQIPTRSSTRKSQHRPV
ncbi:mannose-ethanolamine phosphotransferase gpi13, partial [Ascosphaera pollenicola]